MIKETPTNLRKLKSYKVYSPTTNKKLEISKRNIIRKYWNLKTKQYNNPKMKGKVSKEILKYIILNEKKNKTYQNLWDTAKAMVSGHFKALNAYIRKF